MFLTNVMVESHQKYTLSGTLPSASLASRYNRDNNNAPHNSSRGMEMVFKGATRDLAHSNLLITSRSLPIAGITKSVNLKFARFISK